MIPKLPEKNEYKISNRLSSGTIQTMGFVLTRIRITEKTFIIAIRMKKILINTIRITQFV